MCAEFFRVFSIALYAIYFTLPDVQSLIYSEFDDFDGERICTDSNTHYTPETYCSGVDINAKADCTSLNLLMSTGSNEFDFYVREIVACRVKNIIVACISGGKTDDTYLIWGYLHPEPETPSIHESCILPTVEVRIPDANADSTTTSDTGTRTDADAK